MNIRDYINFESERQSATPDETEGMWNAYTWLSLIHTGPVTEGTFKTLCFMINGQTDYRTVPAVFNQGNPALPAQQIEHAMENLVNAINDGWNFWVESDDIDYLTKEFLLIHPFTDGNGRVASLIWNYLSGTLANPEPMPYFFGEG